MQENGILRLNIFRSVPLSVGEATEINFGTSRTRVTASRIGRDYAQFNIGSGEEVRVQDNQSLTLPICDGNEYAQVSIRVTIQDGEVRLFIPMLLASLPETNLEG